MKHEYEAIIVGLGAMGSAALAALAGRGVRVLGLDAFEPPHDRGSSHGWSRVVRQAYFEHPDYVPLLKQAFDAWDELGERTGKKLLHRVGVLIAGAEDSAAVTRSRDSARQHGIEVADLDERQLRAHYPQFELPDGMIGLLEPGGGFVVPEHAIAAQLAVAREDGAELRLGTRVRGLTEKAGIVEVALDHGIVTAPQVIVTAGAWLPELLPEVARLAELVPQRKVLTWFEPADPVIFSSDRMPVWLIDDHGACGDGVYYGIPTFPEQPGPAGVKVGFHGPGPIVDPNAERPEVHEVVDRFRSDMRRYLPALGPVVAHTTCLYTMSSDEHFVIDRVPSMPRVIVGGGFSGHGFKFAPAIGNILADTFERGEVPPEARFLALSR